MRRGGFSMPPQESKVLLVVGESADVIVSGDGVTGADTVIFSRELRAGKAMAG